MTGVGLAVPQMGPGVDGGLVMEFARRAEAAGFTSLWVQEHFFHPLQPSSDYAGIAGARAPEVYRSCLAPTELLTAVACATQRCAVGTSILVAGYHRPVELAQRLSTIDILSDGRLVVGLGAGWSAEEHRQMDVDPKTRGARMTELVAALRACWEDDPVEFHGRFFDWPAGFVSPKPIQDRITLLAGTSSRAGLERTALHFDGWNPAGVPIAALRKVVPRLQAMRPDASAPLSVWPRLFVQSPVGPPDPDAIPPQVGQAREAGFAEVIIDAHFWEGIEKPSDWLDLIDRYAELTPGR
ncbi:MAG: TIGR03619 family F420-dependent LLM class oxidoreductase [Microthrixaceae bacterium]